MTENSWHTEQQELLDVIILTLNQALDCEFEGQFLCAVEYNSVVKGGFRQKLKEDKGVSDDEGIKHVLPSEEQLAP